MRESDYLVALFRVFSSQQHISLIHDEMLSALHLQGSVKPVITTTIAMFYRLVFAAEHPPVRRSS